MKISLKQISDLHINLRECVHASDGDTDSDDCRGRILSNSWLKQDSPKHHVSSVTVPQSVASEVRSKSHVGYAHLN